MKIDPNEPAFPVNGPNGDHPGMTVRALIAVKAMEGLLAADTDFVFKACHVADMAVKHADALIARLNEGERP